VVQVNPLSQLVAPVQPVPPHWFQRATVPVLPPVLAVVEVAAGAIETWVDELTTESFEDLGLHEEVAKVVELAGVTTALDVGTLTAGALELEMTAGILELDSTAGTLELEMMAGMLELDLILAELELATTGAAALEDGLVDPELPDGAVKVLLMAPTLIFEKMTLEAAFWASTVAGTPESVAQVPRATPGVETSPVVGLLESSHDISEE